MSWPSEDSSSPNLASISQEVLKQDVTSSSSSRMLRVTLLADEWGSSKGGLSTINRELAKQLAKHPNVEVTFFVPKCSEVDKKDAVNLGITVVEAKERPGFEPVDWLISPPSDLSIDVVIGHGVKLGRQAQFIRESHHCKWAQVVHIAPEELAMYKGYSEAISRGGEKHQAEIQLCAKADFVVAVGPKLADDFSAYLRSCKKEVFDLTPSILNEFAYLEQAPQEGKTFRLLVFGRGDTEDFELKGYDIAAQAVAELKDPTYHLIFVGAPNGKEEEVKENFLRHGISRSQLTVRSFHESREKLANLFCEADLAIMPSRTEGFGLTALEALSAGLPILVTGNSGFGEVLKKVPFGQHYIVDSEDAKVWAKEIKDVRTKNREGRLNESQVLRTSYAKQYNWQKQCEELVGKLLNMTHDLSGKELGSKGKGKRSSSNTGIQTLKRLKLTTGTEKVFQDLQKPRVDANQISKEVDLLNNLRQNTWSYGFIISNNDGGGDCMFYALAEQLWLVKGISISHGELRRRLVAFLQSNPKLASGTDLYSFVANYSSWSDYLKDMGKDGNWGDHVVLVAAANCFQVPIRIISSLPNHRNITIDPEPPVDNTNPLVLGHVHELHYVSLRPVQGHQSGDHLPSSAGTASHQLNGFQRGEHVTSPSGTESQPHNADESMVQHKRPLSPSSTQDPKGTKFMPHTEASPAEPFDVKTCRSKLADHYTRTARVPTTVWSAKHHVDIHQIYTRLSWVREEHTTTGSSQTKLEHYTDVFRQTKNGVLPKRILVQGQTGIGKSTFVKKLAVDWAELHHGGSTGERKEAVDWAELDQEEMSDERKEALRKFELVLVVKLRDIKQCQSLTELITSSHMLPKDDSTLMNGLLDFVTKNQEKVLLVLDGYDEYSGESESVIREIFQRDVLRDCCVVVTSRPSKADELRGFADAHAEITGFSYEDVIGFICRMLGSEKEVDDLLSCLIERNLFDLASVPLLLLFYCTLWKKGKWESFPENRTELYMSIVQCLLDYGHGKRADGCYSKVEDYKEILAEMGKVALEALLKDDLVFDYDKLSEAVRGEGSRIIGLLQVTEYAENERPAGKVSFIHKSIQEFLAAWYITHRCIPEGNLGPVEKEDIPFEKCLFLENVLLFVCGLSVDGARKVLGWLGSVRICDPTVDVSKMVVLPGEHKAYDPFERGREFQDYIFECFREAHSKEELLKHCLDCTGGIVLLPKPFSYSSVGEVKDLSSVTDYGDFIITLLSLTSDPCIISGYFNASWSINGRCEVLKLAKFLTKFQHDDECGCCSFESFLWLRDSQIQFYITELIIRCDEHALVLSEALVSPVPSHSADLGSLAENVTTLSCRPLGEKAGQRFSSSLPTNKLETFRGPFALPESCFKFLRRVFCERDGTIWGCLNRRELFHTADDPTYDDSICDLLRHVQNPGNCSLELDGVSLTSAGAVHLASLLPRFNNISINTLVLKDCSGASVISTLAARITNTNLKTLSLENIDLIPEAAVTLCRSQMSGLRKLRLVGKGNSLERGEMESLFGGAKENIFLDTLELCCFNVGSSTAALRDSFRLFPGIRELNLHKLGIDEGGITVLAEGFRHLPNLEELNLSGNPLGHGVRSVMLHITNRPQLYKLDLSNTGCTVEDVEYFHEAFRHLPWLEKLNLSGNPLAHGVRSVMLHITNRPMLRQLDLSNTGCTVEDVEYFHEAFRHLPWLEELNLSGNPLAHGVISVMLHITNLPMLYNLDLSNTGCTVEDVEYFHEAFRHLPNLMRLNLSCNPLGHGVRSVMSHITNLPKLRELDLSSTGCTEDYVDYFHEGINTLMQVWDAQQGVSNYFYPFLSGSPFLNLSGNPLGHGVRSIVSNISNFPKNGALNLRDTGCSEEDVRFVCETIKSQQLQRVVISRDAVHFSEFNFFICI